MEDSCSGFQRNCTGILPPGRIPGGSGSCQDRPRLRVALYHRASTTDQDAELARVELRGVARARGYSIALDIAETGSGARNDRPGLAQVLDAARRRKIDVVMVWALDRFGRSVLDVLSNVRALGAAGVRFCAVSQGLDVRPDGDAVSQLTLSVLAAVAEFERELLRERTRMGLAKARRDGRRLGRPPGGTDAARVVALRAADQSWAEIAAALGCTREQARRAASRAEPGAARDSTAGRQRLRRRDRPRAPA